VVTVRGSNGGGPGLGSRHVSEGMGWGPARPVGGGGRQRARGRAACLSTGQGRDWGTDRWDPGTVPVDG
jgi:hypothetical protein